MLVEGVTYHRYNIRFRWSDRRVVELVRYAPTIEFMRESFARELAAKDITPDLIMPESATIKLATHKGRGRNRSSGTVDRQKVTDQYFVTVVPSVHHQGYDARIHSDGIGIVASENGYGTKGDAMRAGVREAQRIAGQGPVGGPSHNRAGGPASVQGNSMKGMKPAEKADEKCLRRLRTAARDNPAMANEYGKILRGEYPQWK